MTPTFPAYAHRVWHPVAASTDLVPRHVYQGQLYDHELAVWRADDGFVNAWENRCLHRGVRLSIGVNDGRELKCQYHGWRYANRTASCTYIPAHPADAPARTICNRTFPVIERYGLVWASLQADVAPDVPELPGLDDDALALRPVVIEASAARVMGGLGEGMARMPGSVTTVDELQLTYADDRGTVVLFVQPRDLSHSVVRALVDRPEARADQLQALRQYNQLLIGLRDRIEAAPDRGPGTSENVEPRFDPVSAELAEMPAIRPSGRSADLRVVVARKWSTGTDIAAFELTAVDGHLPTAQPGSHIDLHLPSGDVRQYSVVNAPGEADRYVIGVKRAADSRGGSLCLHDTVREGDVLAISEPRNNFPLRRDAERTLLIGGGIGITPLLSMATALAHQGLALELHYFARADDHVAFSDRLHGLGRVVRRHLGLGVEATYDQLRGILNGYRDGAQVYVCGPGSMIETTREIAAEQGWPVEKVHFEYFGNANVIDKESSFEVALARSCLTFEVAPGQTILESVRAAGVDLPSSCEQGACGTCLATVIEGEPVHQDVYLNTAEQAAGTTIITCVSRCSSARLVLDL